MDIPTHEQLTAQIDAFLERHHMTESRLGRDATGEPGLVARIRARRNVTIDTLQKLASFMAEHDALLTAGDGSGSATKADENIRPDGPRPFANGIGCASPVAATEGAV